MNETPIFDRIGEKKKKRKLLAGKKKQRTQTKG